MSWEQLKAILDQARADAAAEASEPPAACPIDGALLDARGDGVSACPMGNYIWPEGTRIVSHIPA